MWTSTERAEFTRIKNAFGQSLYDLYWIDGVTDCHEPWLVALSFEDDALVLHIAKIGGLYVALDDELSRISEDQDLQSFVDACIRFVRAPRSASAKIIPLSRGQWSLAVWAALIMEVLRNEIESEAQAGATEPPLHDEAKSQGLAAQDATEGSVSDRSGRARQHASPTEHRPSSSEPMIGLALLQTVITFASIELALSATRAEARSESTEILDQGNAGLPEQGVMQAEVQDRTDRPNAEEAAAHSTASLENATKVEQTHPDQPLSTKDPLPADDLTKTPRADLLDVPLDATPTKGRHTPSNQAECDLRMSDGDDPSVTSNNSDCGSDHGQTLTIDQTAQDAQNELVLVNPYSVNGVSLYLIDVVTDKRVAAIKPDGTIDASVVESGRYSIEVVADEETTGQVGSVAISIDGAKPRVENIAPYALFGDGTGNFYGSSLITDGVKDLTVTLFSETEGQGEATDMQFTFAFTGSPIELTEAPIVFEETSAGEFGPDDPNPVPGAVSQPMDLAADVSLPDELTHPEDPADTLELVTLL